MTVDQVGQCRDQEQHQSDKPHPVIVEQKEKHEDRGEEDAEQGELVGCVHRGAKVAKSGRGVNCGIAGLSTVSGVTFAPGD